MKVKMPKVTVILTSFNHAKYIREAIESTLHQTFADFELIILDDCSSDNSWDLINQYTDPRVKAFRSEGQGEVVYRLNSAISDLATGEYIAIHHSDDVWELDKLEKQVAFLDAHLNIGAVFTWVQIIDEHGGTLTGDWFDQENKTQWKWLNQLFLEQNHLNHPSVLIRKQCYQAVGLFRYGLHQTGDAEMWSRVIRRFPIHIIQEKLTKHRLPADKSNTSGPRIEVAIRMSNEWNVLRENYLSITNFEDIVEMFPSLERFRNLKGSDNKFLLAMACLYDCKQRNAWQLGLKWLFDLLNDKTRYKSIRELYSFSYTDFIRLTAEFDVYEQRSLAALEGQAANLKQAMTERDKQIEAYRLQTEQFALQLRTAHGQAANLKQAMAERDKQIEAYRLQAEQFALQLRAAQGQIANINQAVSERDGQITGLKIVVTGFEKEIAAFGNSLSWRITKPLRFVSRLFKGKRNERQFSEPRSLKLPVMRLKRTYQGITQDDRDELPNDFNRAMYAKLNPDVAESGMDPTNHYLIHGRHEGRVYILPDICPDRDFKADRDTILVVSHEASRTGAPVLSLNLVQALVKRYNVVALLLDDGPLSDAFRAAGAAVMTSSKLGENPTRVNMIVGQLCERFHFKFALVNSIESRGVLPALGKRFVPVISLIHEFASYIRPRDAFRHTFIWSGEVVFSAKVTLENALAEYPDLDGRSSHVLPQGRCLVPLGEFSEEQLQAERGRIRRLIRPKDIAEDSVVVLGAGFVQIRKGVDLFIECAARVVRAPGGRTCRFIWIGKGYDPDNDVGYSVYLADQIRRAGLQGHVFFIDETPAIEAAYEEADLFLLSSRLDPLPNVAIDAMAHGVPVLCFNKTTGIADFLIDSGLGDHCVAEYLNSADMADKIAALAGSQALRDSVADRCRKASIAYFNMENYVSRLEVLARGVCDRTQQEKADIQVILSSGLFRQDFSVPPHRHGQSIEAEVHVYVRSWASGIDRRKPFPGFHPGIYVERHGVAARGTDPLADYVRAGRPDGPWNYPVIVTGATKKQDLPDNQRVALHLHVYYPELLPEITSRLSLNRICPDLFVSIANEKARASVVDALNDYQGRVVDIQLVPNRGRDIGPFLTTFGHRLLAAYEYVGHIHTKKTADIKDAAIGKLWYRFLLENLLGGKSGAMADRILAKMKDDTSIGMVFPDDPNVVGWGANRAFAESLAVRVGLQKLPDHFVFPVGTMFWARAAALTPLMNLKLDWDDYPEEPLPYDGTSLHAIERLFSLSLSVNSLRSAATNIKGLTR